MAKQLLHVPYGHRVYPFVPPNIVFDTITPRSPVRDTTSPRTKQPSAPAPCTADTAFLTVGSKHSPHPGDDSQASIPPSYPSGVSHDKPIAPTYKTARLVPSSTSCQWTSGSGERFITDWQTGASYCITRKLGQGAFGRVVAAQPLGAPGPVAIKIIDRAALIAKAGRETAELLIFNELHALKATRRHAPARVTKVMKTFQNSDEVFMVMDHYALSLEKALRSNEVCARQRKLFSAELVDALEMLHSLDLYHRDIKPANILLDKDGRTRLADFGLTCTSDQLTADSSWGTDGYMPPEVALGAFARPGPSDVWSLGMVLLELFLVTSGRRMHTGLLQTLAAEDRRKAERERRHDAGELSGPFATPTLSRNDFNAILLGWFEGKDDRVPEILRGLADKTAADMISGMLAPHWADRLTLGEVKQHAYFDGVDWDMIRHGHYDAVRTYEIEL